ncbi:MAG: hypothetical protein J2P19_09680 [Pseudonocardia sp.]|nr:hypothetical protein [Pseudonocardia sp.]
MTGYWALVTRWGLGADGSGTEIGVGLLETPYFIAVLVPSAAVGACPLHDISRGGWWQLLMVPPLAADALARSSSRSG